MKHFLAAILAGFLCGLVPVAEAVAVAFSDLSVIDPHRVAIEVLSEEGIVSGYPDGTFAPERLVNRAEAVKLVVAFLGLNRSDDFPESPFFDVAREDWFAPYVLAAWRAGLVTGNPDGGFAPARTVVRAELLKMLLAGVDFNAAAWEGGGFFSDVPAGQWFTAQMNYAGKSGLVCPEDGRVFPARDMTRGEVAETLYMLKVIGSATDPVFLLAQSDRQIDQIEPYLSVNDQFNAKRAAGLAVDMTYQAVKAAPEDRYFLGKARLAQSYAALVDAYLIVLELRGAWTAGRAAEAEALIGQAVAGAEDSRGLAGELGTDADYVLKLAEGLSLQLVESAG